MIFIFTTENYVICNRFLRFHLQIYVVVFTNNSDSLYSLTNTVRQIGKCGIFS